MNAPGHRVFPYSWEQAVEMLRRDPAHRDLIFHSYLGADLADNGRRFFASAEFAEALRLLRAHKPGAKDILDIPGGNGIATHAFAKAGFTVTTVEPDPSPTVGRGAITSILAGAGLNANIVDAYGENLPFEAASFDIVYVRQGLHHAADLPSMLTEYARILRPGGLLLACREHVVDDYGKSLEAFLASQVDHQLYGGEHAFTLADYHAAFDKAALVRVSEFGPFDSSINLHPMTFEELEASVLLSRRGKILSLFLPTRFVARIGLWWLRRKKAPGRLYTFLARNPAGTH
jgi:ubiquinone/menaquinone biosynthesis C-methylase UbiE